MSLSFRVGPIAYPIGTGDFLGAFFDTITVRLEGARRGSRFPLMAALYQQGELDASQAPQARTELATARDELSSLAPRLLVWDIDDPSARPPWGDDIAPTITDLGNYFVTSDGRQLIEVLDTTLETSARITHPVRIS